MIPRPRPAALLLPALALLLSPLAANARLHAAKDDFELLFGFTKDKAKAAKDFVLRPNVQQEIYVFVNNKSKKDETVTVEVRADGQPAEGGTLTLLAKAESITPAPFGKAAAPADKAADKAPEKPADKGADKPPTLGELKGEVEFVLSGKNPMGNVEEWDKKTGIKVRRASEYLEEPKIRYTPARPSEGVEASLEVLVTAKKDFAGPPCVVELVLNPERIPNLDPEQTIMGSLRGSLSAPEKTQRLTAERLKFRRTAAESRQGLVYLTVDGVERAFTFETTFREDGDLAGQPQALTRPVLRLNAPKAADPKKDLLVGVEVDTPGEYKAELALGRVDPMTKEFAAENDQLVRVFEGDRQQTMLFSAKGPGGSLLFKPEQRDWSALLDVKQIFGVRALRLTLSKGGKAERFLDSAARKDVEQILQTLVLDGTPPVIQELLYNAELARRDRLALGAVAEDPESGIRSAFFYLGKPDKDGKEPANAAKVEGVYDEKQKAWVAFLDPPTDKAAKFDVTVEFTNKADLKSVKSVEIVLKDAGPGGPGARPSIIGRVEEGGRGQPKVAVALRDSTTLALKDTTLTNDKGEFIFKDVPAGSYVVTAVKSGDATAGSAAVTVVDKDKKDVLIRLFR
jgi:hypothetical protein